MDLHVAEARAAQYAINWDEGLPLFDPMPFLSPGCPLTPAHVTRRGALFAIDCMELLPDILSESVDTVFADPPFNLGKQYRSGTNDKLTTAKYVQWCEAWITECVRVLKPGGAIFLYNIPKWNILFGAHLSKLGLDFRHWIAIELNLALPIPNRLYPCHYSLLYYTKGAPKTFRKIRTPIQTCRHCGGEVKDYGGHRDKMNPDGVNLKDVWTDIPPVRHAKFKHESRKGVNAISTKITDRVIEMSTCSGDLVFDPFGGTGTTYVSCERLDRNWIGAEIDYSQEIIDRLVTDDIKPHENGDWVEADRPRHPTAAVPPAPMAPKAARPA
jgi:site-specific DNA-methyltransferase (adenine-specific)